MLKEFKCDQLNVKIFNTRDELGKYAASEMSKTLVSLLGRKDYVNIVFAAAPSQNEFLTHLTQIRNIDWSRVNAFHMDEYVNLPEEAPQKFGNFLKMKIFDKVPFKSVNYIDGNAADLPIECQRYSKLLKEYPPDIICMGIGENGHIAFNDPSVADFNDPQIVKIVELDRMSRFQQVRDGCFNDLSLVPKYALTLTIPILIKGNYLFCMVPGLSKAEAVFNTLNGNITEKCPASILRTHKNATLYLDEESASKLKDV